MLLSFLLFNDAPSFVACIVVLPFVISPEFLVGGVRIASCQYM